MAKSVQIWPHWFYTKLIPFLEGPGRCFLPLRFGPREGLECCQEDAPTAPMRRCFNVKLSLEVGWHLPKKGPQKTSRNLKKKKNENTSLYKDINEKGTLDSFLRIRHQNGDSNLWKMLLQKSPVGSYPSTPPSTSMDCIFPLLLSASALDDVLTFGPFGKNFSNQPSHPSQINCNLQVSP